MSTTSSRMGLILPDDSDVVASSVATLNVNTTALDTNVSATTNTNGPFSATVAPSNPYDGQLLWNTNSGGKGLLRWDASKFAWKAVRDWRTSKGYVGQAVAAGAISISSGSAAGVSINSIAVPVIGDSFYEIVSQGVLVLSGSPPANTVVDVYHYFASSEGGYTNPDINLSVGYSVTTLDSTAINQRIPYYFSQTVSSENFIGQTVPYCDHCIKVVGTLTGGAVGFNAAVVSANVNKMFFYNLGSDAFS